jgi:hypothetical protein
LPQLPQTPKNNVCSELSNKICGKVGQIRLPQDCHNCHKIATKQEGGVMVCGAVHHPESAQRREGATRDEVLQVFQICRAAFVCFGI